MSQSSTAPPEGASLRPNRRLLGPGRPAAAQVFDRSTPRLIQHGLQNEGFDPGTPVGLRTRAAAGTGDRSNLGGFDGILRDSATRLYLAGIREKIRENPGSGVQGNVVNGRGFRGLPAFLATFARVFVDDHPAKRIPQLFLIPLGVLVAALGVASTEPLKTSVSLIGWLVAALWVWSAHGVDSIPITNFDRSLLFLPWAFAAFWFLSFCIHAHLWFSLHYSRRSRVFGYRVRD